MQIIPLHAGDRLQMKKQHPCGGGIFAVMRVGSEVRIKCETCGRDMTIDRVKLEKSIRRNLTQAEDTDTKKGSD